MGIYYNHFFSRRRILATETFEPCTLNYKDCVNCPRFEECPGKDFVADGKFHLWLPIYMAVLFATLLYILA